MHKVEPQQRTQGPAAQEMSESQGKSLPAPIFHLNASSKAHDGEQQPHAETLEGGEPIVKVGGGTCRLKESEGPRQIAQRIYFDVQYSKDLLAANPTSLFSIGQTINLPVIEIPMGKALHDREDNQVALMQLLSRISNEDFETYRSSLTQEDRVKDGNFIQRLDMMRETGMTFKEMGDKQLEFMEEQAEKGGKTVGEYMVDVMKSDGLGAPQSGDWADIKQNGDPKSWYDRFDKLVAKVQSSAPEDVQAVLKKAKTMGGGQLIFKPEEAEKINAFAYTNNDWRLYGGVEFVKSGEQDIQHIYASIVHELGGHNEYGNPIGGDIAYDAVYGMSKEDQKTVKAGDHSISSSYGYFDTELWSELREHKYDAPGEITDRPFIAEGKKPAGVKSELLHIKEAFEPSIALALVRSLYNRAKIDETIMPETRVLFAADIKEVFGLDLK